MSTTISTSVETTATTTTLQGVSVSDVVADGLMVKARHLILREKVQVVFFSYKKEKKSGPLFSNFSDCSAKVGPLLYIYSRQRLA